MNTHSHNMCESVGGVEGGGGGREFMFYQGVIIMMKILLYVDLNDCISPPLVYQLIY